MQLDRIRAVGGMVIDVVVEKEKRHSPCPEVLRII